MIMKYYLALLFYITWLDLISQAAGAFPRVLSRPENTQIDVDIKVVDYQTANCDLEPNCNYLYPVLIENFDFPADLPNKWRFDLGWTKTDDVGDGYSTWFGDALNTNTTTTVPLNSENYQFNGGIMQLQFVQKSPPINRDQVNYRFTSGMIQSLSRFRTGVFEARIKVPPANKMFPAFWLLSNKGQYTEIDIFEYFDPNIGGSSCDTYDKIRMSTHNGSGGNRIDRSDRYPLDGSQWHDYKLEWNDYEIRIYIDGSPLVRGYSTKFIRLSTPPFYHCQYGDNAHPLDPLANINCSVLNSMPDNLFPPVPQINWGPKPWWLPNGIPWPPPQPPQPYLANRISKEKIFPDKNSAMSLFINNFMYQNKYGSSDFSNFSAAELKMEIDWVRVYQPFCCGTDKSICGMADLDNQTYNTGILTGHKISIGYPNNSCNLIQHKPGTKLDGINQDWTDRPIILLATNEIAIQGEAIFAGHTYAEMRITDCGSPQRLSNAEENELNEMYNNQQQILDSINSANKPIFDSIINAYQKNYIDSVKKELNIMETADIEIAPNPVVDIISINTSEWNYNNIVSLLLVDVSGIEYKMIKEKKINISSFKSGTYHLKFILNDNTIIIKKIIKI
jgi:hypothetical protein